MCPPEQGYELAKYQRPGVKVCVGPLAARDEFIDAVPPMYGKPYGDYKGSVVIKNTATTWFEYDCAKLVGKQRLSSRTLLGLELVRLIKGDMPSREDVEFFDDEKTTLVAARARIKQLIDSRTTAQ